MFIDARHPRRQLVHVRQRQRRRCFGGRPSLEHLGRPADGDVADPLARREWARVGKTARGAAGLGRGFEVDPALPGTRQFGAGDAVAGGLKMAVAASGRRAAGSIRARSS
jgi:hypothetical protein